MSSEVSEFRGILATLSASFQCYTDSKYRLEMHYIDNRRICIVHCVFFYADIAFSFC